MSWGRHSRRRSWDSDYSRFPVYVPVAVRRAKAETQAKKLAVNGTILQPVRLEGKKIAATFWGESWCRNLESYSDYANRLPRGRTYLRNGSVLHLDIRKGEIVALVSGSSLYKIKIKIKPVNPAKWAGLCKECAGGIGSLMELLAGKLSERVMNVMTRPGSGLFPAPSEIELDCSCPDWADMCKHVAAVMYGVGARLDQKPELLFLLRHVDHNELVSQASAVTAFTDGTGAADTATLDASEVDAVFGIELTTDAPAKPAAPARPASSKAAKLTKAIKPAKTIKPAKAPKPGAKKPEPKPRQQGKLRKKIKRSLTAQRKRRPAAAD